MASANNPKQDAVDPFFLYSTTTTTTEESKCEAECRLNYPPPLFKTLTQTEPVTGVRRDPALNYIILGNGPNKAEELHLLLLAMAKKDLEDSGEYKKALLTLDREVWCKTPEELKDELAAVYRRDPALADTLLPKTPPSPRAANDNEPIIVYQELDSALLFQNPNVDAATTSAVKGGHVMTTPPVSRFG